MNNILNNNIFVYFFYTIFSDDDKLTDFSAFCVKYKNNMDKSIKRTFDRIDAISTLFELKR